MLLLFEMYDDCVSVFVTKEARNLISDPVI